MPNQLSPKNQNPNAKSNKSKNLKLQNQNSNVKTTSVIPAWPESFFPLFVTEGCGEIL